MDNKVICAYRMHTSKQGTIDDNSSIWGLTDTWNISIYIHGYKYYSISPLNIGY